MICAYFIGVVGNMRLTILSFPGLNFQSSSYHGQNKFLSTVYLRATAVRDLYDETR